MSLKDFKMSNLKDKLENEAEELRERLEKEDEESKRVIKKSAKKE